MFTKINLLCLFSCLVLGMISVRGEQNKKPITEACLMCMCEALTGCNDTEICVNGACGIFRLTRDQWSDSGRLVVGNDSPVSDSAFTNCANDPICSADSLQNYMVKYSQDCNRDQQEDCYDYNAIHYMGPFNCQADMPYNYASIFNKCIRRTLREEKRQQKQQQS